MWECLNSSECLTSSPNELSYAVLRSVMPLGKVSNQNKWKWAKLRLRCTVVSEKKKATGATTGAAKHDRKLLRTKKNIPVDVEYTGLGLIRICLLHQPFAKSWRQLTVQPWFVGRCTYVLISFAHNCTECSTLLLRYWTFQIPDVPTLVDLPTLQFVWCFMV